MHRMSITREETQAEAQRQIEEARALVSGPRGASGTPGGIGAFFTGLALLGVGGYLVLNQGEVPSSFAFFGVGGRAGFGSRFYRCCSGSGSSSSTGRAS